MKGYEFVSLAKYKAENLSAKHSQRLFDNTKQCTTDVLKTVLKGEIQKIVEITSDLIGNKITDEITKVPKTSPQSSLETAKSEHDKEIFKEIYIFSDERLRIIDDMRLT